jgi:hypothetical protein
VKERTSDLKKWRKIKKNIEFALLNGFVGILLSVRSYKWQVASYKLQVKVKSKM